MEESKLVKECLHCGNKYEKGIKLNDEGTIGYCSSACMHKELYLVGGKEEIMEEVWRKIKPYIMLGEKQWD